MKEIPSHPKFCFRLSVDERALFERAARLDGKESLGTWIKSLMRDRVEVLRGLLHSKEDGAGSS